MYKDITIPFQCGHELISEGEAAYIISSGVTDNCPNCLRYLKKLTTTSFIICVIAMHHIQTLFGAVVMLFLGILHDYTFLWLE